MLGPAEHLTAWEPQAWPVADDWRPVIARFLASPAGCRVERFVRDRLAAGAIIYPPQPFHALALTPLAQVKVVILGQDPYHGPGQAHGLAFSVPPGVRPPPSLRNIRMEIDRERRIGVLPDSTRSNLPSDRVHVSGSGNLASWARQGVLLLNTCLTVEQGQAGSHANRGWEALTDDLIIAASTYGASKVFMLWGAHAQSKRGLVDASRPGAPMLTLTANHPSPLSARRKPEPFLGCDHFGLANAFLLRHGVEPVDW